MIETHISYIMVVYAIALLLAVGRLIKGPTLADRVVSLDFIMTCVIGMIVVDAVATGESHFLSVAIVAALLGFVGTLAFAMYIQRRAGR
jgi:multicomponent Na+:H+ antiporter subunit F